MDLKVTSHFLNHALSKLWLLGWNCSLGPKSLDLNWNSPNWGWEVMAWERDLWNSLEKLLVSKWLYQKKSVSDPQLQKHGIVLDIFVCMSCNGTHSLSPNTHFMHIY